MIHSLREKIEEIFGEKSCKLTADKCNGKKRIETILSLITADREAHGKASLEALDKVETERFEGSCDCCSAGYGFPDTLARQAMIDADRIYRENH